MPSHVSTPLSYEDFPVGRLFVHHWGRTITESDAISFATQTHQYQPVWFNRDYASELGHVGLPACDALVFSVVLGLSVEDLSESGGPFLGADDLRFLAPVHVGDTLYARSVVIERRESGSRPGWGVVAWETTGVDQHGTAVLTYRRASLVRRAATGDGE